MIGAVKVDTKRIDKPKSARLGTAALFLVAGLLASCRERVPLITIQQLEQRQPFNAVVLKVDDFPDVPSGPLVIVYVQDGRGDKFGLLGEGNNDFRKFAKTLFVKRSYEFPKMWLDYKSQTTKTGREIFQRLAAADKAYRTNDALNAKLALINHRADLQKWRAANVTGIDYDFCLATTFGRLFVLGEYLKDQELAAAAYQQSTQYFNAVRKATRQPTREYSTESIRDLIARWDATDHVEWRAEAARKIAQ